VTDDRDLPQARGTGESLEGFLDTLPQALAALRVQAQHRKALVMEAAFNYRTAITIAEADVARRKLERLVDELAGLMPSPREPTIAEGQALSHDSWGAMFQRVGYRWPVKRCPCGDVQQGECLENGCEWERNPSLVPELLRIPVAPIPASQQEAVDEARLRSTTDAVVWAEEFAKVCPSVDRELMVTWFANCSGNAEMLAASQQEARQELTAYGEVEEQIVGRFRVEKTKGGFWPYCVRAGDGTMELFIGQKRQCENVAQALQTACLDGAFMASQVADRLIRQPAQAREDGRDAARIASAPAEGGGDANPA
jgi:hypothetical protein